MPILSSVGALTYAKIELDANRNYWGYGVTTTDGTNTVIGIVKDLANQNILLGTNINSQYMGFLKINGYSNPTAEFYKKNIAATTSGTPVTTPVIFKNIDSSNTYPTFGGCYRRTSGNVGLCGFSDASTGDLTPRFMPNSTGVNPGELFIHNMINDSGTAFYVADIPVAPLTVPNQINIKQLSDETGSGTVLAESVLGFSFSTTINKYRYCASLLLTTTDNPTIFYNLLISDTETRTILKELDQTPTNTGYPIDILPNVWDIAFYKSNTIILASQHMNDSSNNIYAVARDNSGNGYLIKVNSSGTLQWQREVTGIKLYGLFVKDSSTIYVVGLKSGGDIWVAEYNDSGTIQWQNLISASTAFTVNSLEDSNLPDNSLQIIQTNEKLFIGCQRGSYATVLCLPDDGSIPGSGSYNWSPSGTMTYAVATETEASGSLSTDTPPSIIGVSTSQPFTNTTNTNTNANGISTAITYLG